MRASLLRSGAFCALVASTLPVAVEGQSTSIETRTLENGLQVIVAPSGIVPLSTVEVVFRNGAFTQVLPEQEGLPHLLEHMLFRGMGDFGSRAADMDGTYNGTTGAEAVTYYITLPSDNVEDAIDLMSDLVRDPDFKRSQLEDENDVVRGELERAVADPDYLLRFYRNQYLWGTAVGRKNAIGDVFTIQGIDTDDLKDHYRSFYVPNNAALVVTGDVEPDVVLATVEERFRRWKREDDPLESLDPPEIPPLTQDTLFVVNADVHDVTFNLSWHGPSYREAPKEALAAEMFVRLVALPTGPFRKALIDTGFAHSVAMTTETLNHVSPLDFLFRTMPERSGDASRTVQDLFARVADPGFFTEEHLAAARTGLDVTRAFQGETVTTLAHTLARRWAVTGEVDPVGRIEALRAITLEDVRSFAEKYLVQRPWVVGMLVSESNVRRHEATLVQSIQGWSRR